MGELIANLDNYSIYKSYINEKDSYYLCIPTGNINKCQIVLGFSDKELNTLSHDEIIFKIKEVYDIVYSLNNDSIYAVPNIKENELKDAVIENDDRLYDSILNNRIHPITIDIYNMLVKNNIKKQNINQVIHIIRRTDSDKKIAAWLSMRLGDHYIKEIDYDELLAKYKLKEDNSRIEISSIISNNGVNIPIIDESNLDDTTDNSLEIAPVNHTYENDQVEKKDNKLVRRLTKPVDKSPGFSSFKFIITTLLISLVAGLSISYLLIKK